MAFQQNFRSAFNGFNREDVVHYIDYLNTKLNSEIQRLNSELDFLRSKPEKEKPAPGPEQEDSEDTMAQQAARIRELFDQNKALEQELSGVKAEKEQLALQLQEAMEAGEALTAEKDQLAAQLQEAMAAGEALTAEKDQLAAQLQEAMAAGEALTAEKDGLAAQLQEAMEAGEALTAEKDQLAEQLEQAQKQQDSYKSHMEEELEAYRRAERTERVARERAEQLYRQANGALADATIKVDDAAGQIGQISDRVIAQLSELQTAVAGSKQALRDAAATMYTIRPSTEEN